MRLYRGLPRVDYPEPNLYYVRYEGDHDAVRFFSSPDRKPLDEKDIPSTSRFFSIDFYDPDDQTTDSAKVMHVSVLNKAYEIARVVRRITAITHIQDVIVIAHSMGGLDARAYIENLASKGKCYSFDNVEKVYFADYNAATCQPGAGDAMFAGDVGDLITLDTPHAGSPLAGVDAQKWILEAVLGKCLADNSVNKSELAAEGLGGTGLLEALNYSGSPIGSTLPTLNVVPIQAVQDYFNDVFHSWTQVYDQSDDIVKKDSQSIRSNLPVAHSAPGLLQDVPVKGAHGESDGYASNDPDIIGGHAECSVALGPVLHFLSCIGALPPTQDAVLSQVKQHLHGALTQVNVEATFDGQPWSGSISFSMVGPDRYVYIGSTVPTALIDLPVGAYNLNYHSGGPPGAGAPVVVANPGTEIKPGQWYLKFTLLFSSQPSVALTSPATSITGSGGTLNGTINPEGHLGYAGFYWGKDQYLNTYQLSCQYWNWCQPVTPNHEQQAFSSHLSGLDPNTTYRYRMVFYDSSLGKYQYGDIRSFKTLDPTPATEVADSITASAAKLNSELNPLGDQGYMGYYWGDDPLLRTYTLSCRYWNWCPSVRANFSLQPFPWTLSGLVSSKTYYYRAVFYDTDNNSYHYGTIKRLTTANSTVTTQPAVSITASTVTLNEAINSQGDGGYAAFYWGTDRTLKDHRLSCEQWTWCATVRNLFTSQPFSSRLSGLASNTTYYYRAVYHDTNNNSDRYGVIRSFKTKLAASITLDATSVTGSRAQVNGTVNPQGDGGQAGFYWGTDANLQTYSLSCGQWWACPYVMANFTTQPFSAVLSSLDSRRTYYYRMVFYDNSNNSYRYGEIKSFTTALPFAATQDATNVTGSRAQVNGTVNPQGDGGQAGFYWGTDSNLQTYSLSCGQWWACPYVMANFTPQPFSAVLSSLDSNKTYYYRMVFYDNSNGSYRYGDIKSFTTALPVTITLDATSITDSSAQLIGTVNPQGDGGQVAYYWGTDPELNTYSISCGQWWQWCPYVSQNYNTQPFPMMLSSLASNTTYYYRIVFLDTSNSSYHYGGIKSFTTAQVSRASLRFE